MRGYWYSIGLRALAVFVIGFGLFMVGRNVARHAEHEASHLGVEHAMQATENALHATEAAVRATTGAQAATAAGRDRALRQLEVRARAVERLNRVPGMQGLANLMSSAVAKAADQPFVLDGKQVGTMRRFQLKRAAGAPVEANVTVLLAPDAAVTPCDVSPANPDDFDLDAGFRCASDGDLVPVGRIRFDPAGAVRALKVSPGQASQLAAGDPVDVDAQLGDAMRIDVRENGREKVTIRSDGDGSAMVITNDEGKVVRIAAGASGVSVTVDSAPR